MVNNQSKNGDKHAVLRRDLGLVTSLDGAAGRQLPKRERIGNMHIRGHQSDCSGLQFHLLFIFDLCPAHRPALEAPRRGLRAIMGLSAKPTGPRDAREFWGQRASE